MSDCIYSLKLLGCAHSHTLNKSLWAAHAHRHFVCRNVDLWSNRLRLAYVFHTELSSSHQLFVSPLVHVQDTSAPVTKCWDTLDMPKCPTSEFRKVRSVLGSNCLTTFETHLCICWQWIFAGNFGTNLKTFPSLI